jgi:ATP-dependent RNA helicase UAP56/SUB2
LFTSSTTPQTPKQQLATTSRPLPPNMSHEEDLIDYSDEELQPETTTTAVASNGDANKGAAADSGAADSSFAGVHSAAFSDFLLKQFLVSAIADSGFEHPSEGPFF